MVDDNTLSAQEYAAVKGVSVQSVYKRLKSAKPPRFINVKDGSREVIRIAVDPAELSVDESERLGLILNSRKFKVEENASSCQCLDSTVNNLNQPVQPQGESAAERELQQAEQRIKDLTEQVVYLRQELSKATDEIGRLVSVTSVQAQQLVSIQHQLSAASANDEQPRQNPQEQPESAPTTSVTNDTGHWNTNMHGLFKTLGRAVNRLRREQ